MEERTPSGREDAEWKRYLVEEWPFRATKGFTIGGL